MNIEELPVIEIPSLIIRKHNDMILWRGYLEVVVECGEVYTGLISESSPLLARNQIEVNIEDDDTISVEDRIAAVTSIARKIEARHRDILDTFREMMTVYPLELDTFMKGICEVNWVDSFCWTSQLMHDGNRCEHMQGYDSNQSQAFTRLMDIEYKRGRNELHI
jgi:uncharacterized protein YegJ (DUF2314 family)